MKKIASRENPTYRAVLRLARSRRQRQTEGKIILEGVHLLEAYASAFGAEGIRVVLRASQAHELAHQAWAQRCAAAGSLVFSDTLFDGVSPVATSTGILGLADRPDNLMPPQLRAAGFSVLLDAVQDPGNLGSILRSAAAAGGAVIALSRGCADPWSEKALRGGMGGQFALAIHENQDLRAAALRSSGPVIAADPTASTTIYDVDLPPNTAFVLGSEGQGLGPDVLACASHRIAIPIEPSIESLNVAAAAAVCFFEWRRRRTL